MDAKPINMMDMMCGKGVHAMMGSGWRSEEHTDVFDADMGGWIDKKEGPKERRDQDADYERDRDGNMVRRSDPILAGFMDPEHIEDNPVIRKWRKRLQPSHV